MDILSKINRVLNEDDKTNFTCNECGKKFKAKIGRNEVVCPKCKSTDVEVD
jgi:Zn finger protein HypA/HybF involved in hydrogenase expression